MTFKNKAKWMSKHLYIITIPIMIAANVGMWLTLHITWLWIIMSATWFIALMLSVVSMIKAFRY